jgi:hypothetical protein
MGNIRILKKDIDNQIFEIISDCFIYNGLHPENKTEKVSAIIEDAVNLRNDLISRVNNPESKNDPKLVRQHYRAVKADLAAETDKLCRRLSDISAKKKK